ncbi:MAG: NAD(P)/FAD-dependent oxidoreductase [Alphaproteobacteria bacterium]|nr:NAD(P)/FAD-dependent oxidoreductase [Alphaproteobacteria bacterium]
MPDAATPALVSPADERARTWLSAFEAALAAGDATAGAALFGEQSWWRDLVAFSRTIETVEHRAGIARRLDETAARTAARGFVLDGEASEGDGLVQAWFRFETALGRGVGHIRLRDGKAWTLFTALRELKGFEEKARELRPAGVEHGARRGRRTWSDERASEAAELGITRQPYVLIVGGGQGGIALAARLRRLEVPALVIETNARAGDSWRKRYRSLCLHDPVWYDHLPYLPFPDHWPIYTPKDKLADWLEMYVRVMELPYWTSSTCKSARYDAAAGRWRVVVAREGREIELSPAHLVLATGMSGFPEMPHVPGAERFQGRQHHSSRHEDGAAWRGKHCVVVGANNSAHDIAVDLWEHDAASVTLIQRSSTLVARAEVLATLRGLYSEQAVKRGIDVDRADLINASMPYALLPASLIPIWERLRRDEADFYAGLERAGFRLDFAADGAGIALKYLRRGSGYYIDVGGSALVADGRIGLRSGVELAEMRERSVVTSAGEELPADLVVFATGYGNMNQWAARLISPEVAAKVGPVWGLGSGLDKDPGPFEGELRNMWKPTAQPGLWFHGGNLMQARHYSLYLALQLKARLEGLFEA